MKFLLVLFVCANLVFSHALNYDLEKNSGVAISLSFDKNAPASWADYKIYAPNMSMPYQQGKSDSSGIISFLPNKNGEWKIYVEADAGHGKHSQEILVNIAENETAKIENKPMFSRFQASLSGIGIIFGIFGIWFGFKERSKLQRQIKQS